MKILIALLEEIHHLAKRTEQDLQRFTLLFIQRGVQPFELLFEITAFLRISEFSPSFTKNVPELVQNGNHTIEEIH